jgi:hypothetical protein
MGDGRCINPRAILVGAVWWCLELKLDYRKVCGLILLYYSVTSVPLA